MPDKPLDPKEKSIDVGKYFGNVVNNAFKDGHWKYTAIGAIIAALAVVVVVHYMFGSDRHEEGKQVRKMETSLTSISMLFVFFGVFDLYWWGASGAAKLKPFWLAQRSIKTFSDYTSYWSGVLLGLSILVGIVTFLRLRLKIISWAVGILAMIGLVFLVNFGSALANV